MHNFIKSCVLQKFCEQHLVPQVLNAPCIALSSSYTVHCAQC